ncbi:hypothetical protein [Streptomyces sp. KL116D]|uniref:hypothetical protein n=1 Tax=Streptomyces sp. KL116D TaxID=3045152 RepID=UPI003556973E
MDRLRLFGLCNEVNTLESVLHGLLQATATERGNCLMQTTRSTTARGSSGHVPEGPPDTEPLYAGAP